VISIASKVFEKTAETIPKCQNMALQPEFTTVPKSCSNLAETEITTYAFMPGAWQQNGWLGINSVCETNIQSRDNARDSYRQEHKDAFSRSQSYGAYTSAGPAPYM
jgi:hypothetical protein